MPDHDLPVDPDVDARRDPLAGWDVLAAIAAGGALGSVARWGLGEAASTSPGELPWETLAENVSGSLLLGALMVLVAEVWTGPSLVRYARPFLGVGLLGGWTTFSAYALDVRTLLVHDRLAVAAAYAVGSVLAGLLAVLAGLGVTRRLLQRQPA